MGNTGESRGTVPRSARPTDPERTAADPDRLDLVVEKTDDGIRMTSPLLPGWSYTGRGPFALARGLESAWVEAQILAYAATQATAYDLEHLEARPPEVPRVRPVTNSEGQRVWRYSHDPAAWVPLPGGDWRSPSGRRYGAGTAAVAKVVARRKQLGLPVRAADEDEEATG